MREEGQSKSMPLAVIYLIAPPPSQNEIKDITVDRLSSRDACVELMRNSFRLHINHRKQASDLLARTSEIVSQVPVFSLKYPRDYSCLTNVQAAIINHSKRQI